jgi:hypothetical protein
MTWNDHDHRSEYADERHDHDLDYAEKHHRHYDDESAARGVREDLSRAEKRIRELEDGLRDALNRIHVLEDRQPDYAGEPEPEPGLEEFDPGPEADDEGGMSEYRHAGLGEDWS